MAPKFCDLLFWQEEFSRYFLHQNVTYQTSQWTLFNFWEKNYSTFTQCYYCVIVHFKTCVILNNSSSFFVRSVTFQHKEVNLFQNSHIFVSKKKTQGLKKCTSKINPPLHHTWMICRVKGIIMVNYTRGLNLDIL